MSKLTLPQIQESLGLKISAEFISNTLRIEPSETDRRAKFYSREQYDEIRQALIGYINDRDEILPAPERPAPAAKATKPTPAADIDTEGL